VYQQAIKLFGEADKIASAKTLWGLSDLEGFESNDAEFSRRSSQKNPAD
jgi:hypothetical protein